MDKFFLILFPIAKLLYSQVLRDLLKKAVDNPDEDWDDAVLGIADAVFQYKK